MEQAPRQPPGNALNLAFMALLCLVINYIIAESVIIALCVFPAWGLNPTKAGTVSVWFMVEPPGTVPGTQQVLIAELLVSRDHLYVRYSFTHQY